ncbi:MAG: hypothetical protein O3B73_05640, partial [bacterium]|nr:hypothetical protein [bacterium]
STAAFNALLKTLEEPPPHVIFVFATTEPHKVPETVLSRCQRFNFRRIGATEIVGRLKEILAEKNVEADEAALYQIAHKADGGMRDAQSLLDQVVSFSDSGVSLLAVQSLLGLIPRDAYFELTDAILNRASAQALTVIDTLVREGADIGEFVEGMVEHFRHLLIARATGELSDGDLPLSDCQHYTEVASQFDETDLLRMLNAVSELETRVGRVSEPRFWLELTVMKLVKMAASVDLTTLLAQLETLGKTGGRPGGGAVQPAAGWVRPTAGSVKPTASAPAPRAPIASTSVAKQAPESATRAPKSAPRPAARAQAEAKPVTRAAEPDRTFEPDYSAPEGEEPPPIGELPTQSAPRRIPEPVLAVEPRPQPVTTTAATATTEAAESTAAANVPPFEAIAARWAEFVQEVKGRKISLGTFLAEGDPKSLTGDTLLIAFKRNKEFHANQVRRNRPLVEEVAAAIFGGSIRFDCKVDYDTPSKEDGSEADPRAEDDERVQMVLQVFGGEVM